MSVVWERTVGATRYQVRHAGRSVRLYTNGVLHSQYNPGRPLTGSVWDLLFLPAFFYPAGHIRRVLVLGVGGGAVLQLLRRFIQPELLVGVELNSVHLSVARRFFALRGRDVQLVQADAVAWVKQYRGPGFDLIIDDLFGDCDGEPQRAVHAGPRWIKSLLRCLSDDGALVCNFASSLELSVCGCLTDAGLRRRFSSAFQLSTAQNYNAVGVFLRRPATTRQLRDRLQRIPALDPRRRSSPLNYRIRTLSLAQQPR
ncbi:MAG TPA: oxidoreductase [Gammaproteobacteria bacterium]|nr:oxidoreductase [Gammaproteobacteria bacterium]